MNRTNAKAIIDILIHDLKDKAAKARNDARERQDQNREQAQKLFVERLAKGPKLPNVIEISTNTWSKTVSVTFELSASEYKKYQVFDDLEFESVVVRSPMGNRDYRIPVPKSELSKFEDIVRKFTNMTLLLLTSSDEEARMLVADLRETLSRV